MKYVTSELKENVNSKVLRKYGAYTLDFFICLILSALLFIFVNLIGNNTSYVKYANSEINKINYDLHQYIYESKLDEDDGNGNLVGSSSICKNYVYSLVYESLVSNNVDGISDTIYKDVEKISSDNDNCYYYYNIFKKEKKEEYPSTKYNNYKETIDSLNYYEYRGSDFPYLKKDIAIGIDNYFRNASYSVGLDYYNNIFSTYKTLLSNGIEEFSSYYTPYVNRYLDYNNMKDYIFSIKVYELCISYVLSSVICYLVLPLCLKKGRTLSFLILSLGVCSSKGNNIKWFQVLISFIFNLFKYLIVICLLSFIIYGGDGIYLFNTTLLGFINLFSFMIFSVLFIIINDLVCLFNKNKQSLIEMSCNEVIKDIRYYIIKENKDGQQGK